MIYVHYSVNNIIKKWQLIMREGGGMVGRAGNKHIPLWFCCGDNSLYILKVEYSFFR
jgi:hypothetical protein